MDINQYKIEGFLTITDVDTEEVLVDKKNAIHFGNLAASMADALAGGETGHIRYMAFGDGGTSISPSGEISYKQPDVDKVRNPGASLYSEIYHQEIGKNGTTNDGKDPNNTVYAIQSNQQYADIGMVCTLNFVSPNQTTPLDKSSNLLTDTIFDEIALYTGESLIPTKTNLADTDQALMISHVIFHPIKKTTNRKLKINYTIRIYLEAI